MPAIRKPRLKQGDLTFAEIYKISKQLYYKKVDDKAERMRLDITGARMTQRQNFTYDAGAKQWVQTGLRHLKFIFIVSSKPISYKKTDSIPIHKYPVTVVIYDISLGWKSPFRWRTGTAKKVLFARAGSKPEVRKKMGEQNIRNGRQLDFFFKLEQLLSFYGLLYGPNTTNKKPPNIANPSWIPYFDKHMLFVVEKFLRHLFTKEGIARVSGALTKGRAIKG
jgi:hypothetical protein